MNVFLMKIRAKTPFAWLDPVRVEPLELAYLASAVRLAGAVPYIIDELFDLQAPPVTPDVVVLTGYNTAERVMITKAEELRRRYPGARIIIGGTHAQCNPGVFRVPAVDCVFHSPDLDQFRRLLASLAGPGRGRNDFPEPRGFDLNTGQIWVQGEARPVMGRPAIAADRSLTRTVIGETRYLDKERVALVKSRTGCPFQCDFCYCRLLNAGRHLPPDFDALLGEALALAADHVWVVDDVFLASRRDALAFLDACARRPAHSLRLIVYLRADLILELADLIGALRDGGVREVIVGFEAVTPTELAAYHKQTDALDYPAVIRLLREQRIDLTALFMVAPDYSVGDFRRLARFIRVNRLDTWTVSILTPIKGTRSYDEMKDQLLTQDPAAFDFLHLVTKSRLPRWFFYLWFARLHLGLLRSRRIRTLLRRSLGHPAGRRPKAGLVSGAIGTGAADPAKEVRG